MQAVANLRRWPDFKIAAMTSERIYCGAPVFCRFAGEIIALWEMLRKLFGVGADKSPIRSTRFGLLFQTLNSIVIRYWFLAIAKLHDDAFASCSMEMMFASGMAGPALRERNASSR
jgi:hypothetical protein